MPKMKNLKQDEQGLIPLLLTVLFVVGAIIVYAYLRVAQAQQ